MMHCSKGNDDNINDCNKPNSIWQTRAVRVEIPLGENNPHFCLESLEEPKEGRSPQFKSGKFKKAL